MVKGKREYPALFENAARLAPAFREQPLVEGIRVFRLPRTIRYGLKGLGRVFRREIVWILIFEDKAQPDVEKIGKL